MQNLEPYDLAAVNGGSGPDAFERLVHERYLAQLAELPEDFHCAAQDMAP